MPLECCICTDVLVKGETTISSTPCGHVYHTQCIFEWINKCENGANCPVCRQAFPSSEVVPLCAVSDEDITAIAKAISERVTIEENNQSPRPVIQTNQQPIHAIRPTEPIEPLSNYYNYDTESSSSDDYYEEESPSDRESEHSGFIIETEPANFECDNFEDPDDSDQGELIDDFYDFDQDEGELTDDIFDENINDGAISEAESLNSDVGGNLFDDYQDNDVFDDDRIEIDNVINEENVFDDDWNDVSNDCFDFDDDSNDVSYGFSDDCIDFDDENRDFNDCIEEWGD
ncbi:hypothetical protein ACKWTF_012860 [Chironomus riparius]